jgi:DNA-binding transcriptional regulator YhcF (GntR family)
MLITVDPNSGVPVYRQMMDQIRFQVASGLLAPGDELPSTRALAHQLSINPMTVSKAYSLLERERILERRPGLRIVVRQLPPDALEREADERLRALLEPAVLAAQQLGLSTTKAVRVFRDLLTEATHDVETRR